MVAEYKRGGLWIINHPRVEAMLQAIIVHTAAVTTVQLLLQLSHQQSRQFKPKLDSRNSAKVHV